MKRFLSVMLAALMLLSTGVPAGAQSTSVQVSGIADLPEDFIFGMDISSIIEVENAGGRFYDADGRERDIFELLASYGVNYIRIRLWNDPFDENGNSFGGGGNDIETDLLIAKRAVDAGMKVCLDFHYSDFWADPNKQTVPRAWQGTSNEAMRQLVYDYTYGVLERFRDAGCLPAMVQTGNEINNGLILPNGKTATYQAIYLYSAMSAVKDIDPGIQTVIHLAEGASYANISGFLDKMLMQGVTFDVIGLSYYPYWHGSLRQFRDCLEKLNENYDQKICVMEYSYGFGDDSNEYTGNIFSTAMEQIGGYKATVQGQASCIHDINAAVASVEHGIGAFYWEPAWLPLAGTGWASMDARSYLAAQGDGGGEGTVSWANQALFDFDGRVLPSMEAFRMMRSDEAAPEDILSIEDAVSCSVDLAQEGWTLPETARAFTSLDRWVELDIAWNADELAGITEAGTYQVTGIVACGGQEHTVTAQVRAYYDYLKNGSFDEESITGDVKDFANVTAWDMEGTAGSFRVESKNGRTGSNNLNIWYGTGYENTLSQKICNLTEGTYILHVWARSAQEGGRYPDSSLYVTIGGETVESGIRWGATWSDWVQTSLEFTVTGTQDAVIGIRSQGAAGTWAHFDDFALAKE